MNIFNAINNANKLLKKNGIKTFQLDCELLMSKAIIKDRKYINWKKNELTIHVNAANEIVKHIEEYLNK